MFDGHRRLKEAAMLRSAWLFAILATVFLSEPLAAAEKPDVRAKLVAPARLTPGSKTTLAVEMTIGSGWHVNSHTPSEPYLIPTNVSFAAPRGNLSAVRYPKDVSRRFEFSEKPLRVYEGTVRFEADLEVPAGAGGDLRLAGDLSYQACNERQCFAPAKIPLQATIVLGSRVPSSLKDGATPTEVRSRR